MIHLLGSDRSTGRTVRGTTQRRLSFVGASFLAVMAALAVSWSRSSMAPAQAAIPTPDQSSMTSNAARTYTNPVYNHDFPDPFVLRHDGRFYAYATHGGGYGFQVMESPDLVHWTHRGTAFEVPWSKEHYWAPEVVEYRKRFYMIYSALNPETHKHDLGIATATSPLGPFTHRAILVRAGDNRTGVIDGTLFFDTDKTPYLIYSEEDPRRIVMRKLAPDLLSAEEAVTELVRPDRPWERGVTEAPTLLRRHGRYHLFFSVGWFQSNIPDASYAVCHAVARSVRGPYTKDPETLLASVPGKVYGPGHQSVVTLPSGGMWMAYHAWDAQNEPRYGSNPVGRSLRIDRLEWRGDTPVMHGPTTMPQPVPRVRKSPRHVTESPSERITAPSVCSDLLLCRRWSPPIHKQAYWRPAPSMSWKWRRP